MPANVWQVVKLVPSAESIAVVPQLFGVPRKNQLSAVTEDTTAATGGEAGEPPAESQPQPIAAVANQMTHAKQRSQCDMAVPFANLECAQWVIAYCDGDVPADAIFDGENRLMAETTPASS